MSVQSSRPRGAVVATFAVLALSATGCDDPIASTDLRPEGNPEVLSVLVMNDPDLFIETATFCREGDAKRPGFVGGIGGNVCDDDLSVPAVTVSDANGGGANPTNWYVRVMFDELLDPNVEELIDVLDPVTMLPTGQFNGSLLNTQPVIVTCDGAVVAYDGYYSPSGNNVTWPVGPSLVIQPLMPELIATGAACTIELQDNFTDKQANPVADDQRGLTGEYAFELAALAFLGSSPAPGGKICLADATTCEVDDDCETLNDTCVVDPADTELITPDAPLVLTFNGFINPASLLAGEVTITEVAVDAMGVPVDCDPTAGTAVPNANVIIEADASGDTTSMNIRVSNGVPATCDDGEGGMTACAWKETQGYVITFNAGNEVTDVANGLGALPEVADFNLCFATDVVL